MSRSRQFSSPSCTLGLPACLPSSCSYSCLTLLALPLWLLCSLPLPFLSHPLRVFGSSSVLSLSPSERLPACLADSLSLSVSAPPTLVLRRPLARNDEPTMKLSEYAAFYAFFLSLFSILPPFFFPFFSLLLLLIQFGSQREFY